MIGGIAGVVVIVGGFILFVEWLHGILTSDGRCDPGADCENCPFPCEHHEKKRRDRK